LPLCSGWLFFGRLSLGEEVALRQVLRPDECSTGPNDVDLDQQLALSYNSAPNQVCFLSNSASRTAARLWNDALNDKQTTSVIVQAALNSQPLFLCTHATTYGGNVPRERQLIATLVAARQNAHLHVNSQLSTLKRQIPLLRVVVKFFHPGGQIASLARLCCDLGGRSGRSCCRGGGLASGS